MTPIAWRWLSAERGRPRAASPPRTASGIGVARNASYASTSSRVRLETALRRTRVAQLNSHSASLR